MNIERDVKCFQIQKAVDENDKVHVFFKSTEMKELLREYYPIERCVN